MRDPGKQPGTVAGIFISPDRPTMLQVDQDGQRVPDQSVILSAIQTGDKADPAAILLMVRIKNYIIFFGSQ